MQFCTRKPLSVTNAILHSTRKAGEIFVLFLANRQRNVSSKDEINLFEIYLMQSRFFSAFYSALGILASSAKTSFLQNGPFSWLSQGRSHYNTFRFVVWFGLVRVAACFWRVCLFDGCVFVRLFVCLFVCLFVSFYLSFVLA